MLINVAGRWCTECDRCHASIEVVGSPDRRGKHVELGKAARFLESLGWKLLHRAGRGDRVNWWCAECVEVVAKNGRQSIGHSTAGLDMNPSGEKKRA